jgi:hypothetical protein
MELIEFALTLEVSRIIVAVFKMEGITTIKLE